MVGYLSSCMYVFVVVMISLLGLTVVMLMMLVSVRGCCVMIDSPVWFSFMVIWV